jgi:peptidoglycan lytic transglycosylase
MRRAQGVRELRRSHAALGALIIGIPASAGVFTAGQAVADTVGTQPSSPEPLATHVKSSRIAYGQDVVVDGTAPASDSGQQVQLQFAPSDDSSSWNTVTSTTVSSSGSFRLAAPLKQSGQVRVVASSSDRALGATTASSSTHPVSVAAKLHVPPKTIDDLGGHAVQIRGRLLPGVGGRKVRLEGRSGRGWRTLATARTGSAGRFDLRYMPPGPGQQQLRVRFSGDEANAWTGARAGRLTTFVQTVASWYNDGGNTACGFHAYYGVANRTLPCGTQVTFSSGGRTVTATVDDRGPYVGGRDWDLNENTAAALGFGGVGTVWSSL